MSDVTGYLKQLRDSDEYPLHMPGHKRNYEMKEMPGAYTMDITEIEGYDNLYEAEGMLKDAMEYAAKIYGAEETFFLVNGSTVGLLAAITGVTEPGDRILVARNCHKAVFHAMELRGLQAVYLHPEYLEEWDLVGAIQPEEVQKKLEKYPDIKAVVITSPTYDGIVSPIDKIADCAHKAGIPIIVDEAHGAHLPFDERFPLSALRTGADVVIQSMHKTLPSFTQTALLHMKNGFADTARIKEYVGYYQTSSPSYLFMAGMDHCIREIGKYGSSLWDSFFEMREAFLLKAEHLEHIRIFTDNDPCKLVISVKNTDMTGRDLQKVLLEKYHIQVEMAASTYVLGIITFCDKKEGFDRLADALSEIDPKLSAGSLETVKNLLAKKTKEEDVVYSLSEIRRKKKKRIPYEQAEGMVASDYVNLYPPGIPLLIPGERITAEHILRIQDHLFRKMKVQGVKEDAIWVCCQSER